MSRSDIASEIDYRAMTAADAAALIDLVHRCYEDSYFDAFYYDQAQLAMALDSGRLRSFIAMNNEGKALAHIGVRIPDQHYTAVSSLAIVDPAYRGKGLLAKVGMPLYQLCLEKQFPVIHGQAVTVHTYTQQTNLKGGAAVTGMYLNYIPPGQRFLESEQLSCDVASPVVIMLTPVSPPAAGAAYFPTVYAKQLREAFSACGMPRKVLQGVKAGTARSSIDVNVMPKQAVSYLWVDRIGEDLQSRLQAELNKLTAANLNAVYLHLPLDQTELDENVEALRQLGFFYAGVLPEYRQRDWLILQHLLGTTPNFSGVKLTGEVAPRLFDFIKEDFNLSLSAQMGVQMAAQMKDKT